MGHFIERRQRSGQHKSRNFCYNTPVSRKRDLLFDIGGRQSAPAIGPKPTWVDGKTPVGRDDLIASPLVGRDHRARRSGELRKRIRRPQHIRNSVLGFVAKPLTLHNEKPSTMVRRVSFTRRALYSCFSLRFLAAPATRRNFRVRRFSIPRQSGDPGKTGVEKERLWLNDRRLAQ